jgi:hypothetical protein
MIAAATPSTVYDTVSRGTSFGKRVEQRDRQGAVRDLLTGEGGTRS